MDRQSGRFDAAILAACWALITILSIHAVPAQTIRQRTDFVTTVAGPPALDDAGAVAFVAASTNQFGGNPRHEFQLFQFNPITATGSQVTTLARGVAPIEATLDVAPVASVSDDGMWLAFLSPSDPLGTNHDQGVELFVQRANGSQLAQLTVDSRINSGSVRLFDISGNGEKIAFVWNADPLALNNSGRHQLFVIGRDGTGLRQLTAGSLPGNFADIAIDDGGGRIVFSFSGALPDALDADNDDGTTEIFAVNADGSGLRQLTADDTYSSFAPDLSGDGSTIVFVSTADLTESNGKHQNEIFIIDWDGSNLTQRTATITIMGGQGISSLPSITDDGQVIVYFSNDKNGSINADGNAEIFKINKDGTGEAQLTDTSFSDGSFYPVVSGDGTRIVFYSVDDPTGGNPDLGPELFAMDDEGNGIVQLTQGIVGSSLEPDITPDGSKITFVSDGNLLGLDSDRGGEVYVMDWDGSNLAQVTDLFTGGAITPTISASGQKIVFSSNGDPVGGNIDSSYEVFSINSDGTGLVQISSDTLRRHSYNPYIIPAGTLLFYDSNEDPSGQNVDRSREIMKVLPNGSGKTQLTSGALKTQSEKPRSDDTGTWISFQSSSDLTGANADLKFEIMRIRADGTGLQQITNDPDWDSFAPDISGDASLIVFTSRADLTGGNADHSFEIFLYEVAVSQTTQLTSAAAGQDSTDPRISGDGRYVYFLTTAALFEPDPDLPVQVVRMDLQTGMVERVGGLDRGEPYVATPDQDGDRAAFAGLGDFTEANPDLQSEIWLINMSEAPDPLSVESAVATTVTWGAVAGALRYDVIRGSVANFSAYPGGTVQMGPVVCLENGSPDTNTTGFADIGIPAPGEVFFYAVRPDRGGASGFGPYGESNDGKQRYAGAGNCARSASIGGCRAGEAYSNSGQARLLPQRCVEPTLLQLRSPKAASAGNSPAVDAPELATEAGDATPVSNGSGRRGRRQFDRPVSRVKPSSR